MAIAILKLAGIDMPDKIAGKWYHQGPKADTAMVGSPITSVYAEEMRQIGRKAALFATTEP